MQRFLVGTCLVAACFPMNPGNQAAVLTQLLPAEEEL
jgi:hypothetical protein